MVAHLSQDWLDRYQKLAADLPERAGATARLQHVVTGGPDGQVAYVEVFEDGRVVDATLGAVDDADVTITAAYSDAVAIARVELDLHAGFMQGRVKLVGDMGTFMAVLPATQSAEAQAARAALAAETD